MGNGLATRHNLRRVIEDHEEHTAEEWRGMELAAGLGLLAMIANVGTVVVLLAGAFADHLTGLGIVAEVLRWAR